MLREVAATGAARQVELVVGDAEAIAAGLACGGRARVLLQPTTDVPDEGWRSLAAREPVCLVTDLDETARTAVVGTDALAGDCLDPAVRGLFAQGTSQTTELVLDDGRRVLVTASWPPCRLVVVGEGQLAASLHEMSGVLGWEPSTLGDSDTDAAVDAVRPLGRGDAVLVLSHDIELSGRVLARAT
jgi:xanthine dehydrogenase accessory factor